MAVEGCLPEFAADLDLTGGGEGRAGDCGGADHGLRAHEGLVAVRFESEPGEQEGDDAEAEACSQGGAEVDAEFGDGAVDEGGEAEDERDGSCECEHTVAGELGFEHHHHQSGEEERDGSVADGKEVQAEEADENEEGSEGAGDDGSGDVEFEVDEEAAEDEEEDGEVGIGELGEEALAEGGLDGEDGCAVAGGGSRCCR